MDRIKTKKRMKYTWDDMLYDFICGVILISLVILTIYPVYFVVMASFSDPFFVNNGDLLLYPKGFTMDGYRKVFEDKKVWLGYGNTIIYTVGGTVLGTAIVTMAGYALSRKDLLGRGILMKIFVFTMYFSGGMIPTFLTVQKLGLINTRFAMILLGSVSAYNMIIVRSFMSSNIPDELLDAARIDGCGNTQFFYRVVLPLSKAVISVMILYIAVGYWNSYFNAMIYLTDSKKYPLQMYLREVLFQAEVTAQNQQAIMADPEYFERLKTMTQVIKYSIIVVATAPIMCVYPFIQKHFVKGVMIGSVKG